MAKNDTMIRLSLMTLIASVSLMACGEKLDSDSNSNTPEAKALCAGDALAYYDANVKPIVQQRCIDQCHNVSQYHETSLRLTTCADVSGAISGVIDQVANDRMPQTEPKLTTVEKDIFIFWKDMVP